MQVSGTSALRASRTASPSARLAAGSKRSPPSLAWQAATIALRRACSSADPLTSDATFCSSTAFQSTKSSMSGWSTSTMTILAARRVVPPDLMAPAARSPILRKLIRPDDLPPPDSGSPSPRREEKLVPVPEPYLKSRASRTQRSMMPPSLTRSSWMLWMKQACGWGRS